MEKEKLFIYQLFSSLYKNGCKRIDISNETLKKNLTYLKCMLEEEKVKELESLFVTDEDGVYSNYLKIVSSLDPLFSRRENNEIELFINDEMSNLFMDDDVDYIGIKMAAYIKIKEKEKSIL